MVPVKRVEIVTGAIEFDMVVEVLSQFGIRDYLVHRDVVGVGGRRLASPDPLTGDFENRVIQTICPPDTIDRLVEAIRPIIRRYGGACIVYDAHCVVH